MQRNKSRIFLFILITTVAFFLFPFQFVTGEGEDEPMIPTGGCVPLDVLLIIDQSSSMSGKEDINDCANYRDALKTDSEDFGGKDSKRQRKFGADAMVDTLTDLSLDVCPGTVNRIGVISFGDNAVVDIPLREINPNGSFSLANTIRDELKDDIEAKCMYRTNSPAAFNRAVDEFKKASNMGNENRKKVIIFFTDGTPCFIEGSYSGCGEPGAHIENMIRIANEDLPFDAQLLKSDQCIKEVYAGTPEGGYSNEEFDEKINACTTGEYTVPDEAYENSTYIYTLLLGASEIENELFKTKLEDMSEEHGSRLVPLSKNPQELPAEFKRIVEELATVKIPAIDCGGFVVNPYQKRGIMSFYKYEEEPIKLSYLDINAQAHEISDEKQIPEESFVVADYNSFGVNERYVFSYPYPGVWNLKSENCSGLEAYYQEIEFNPEGFTLGFSNVPQYDIEPYFDADDPHYIEYQMRDSAGKVVEQSEDVRFSVDLDVSVSDPKGNAISYDMVYLKEEKLFRSVDPINVEHLGNYTIDIVGSTIYHEGSPSVSEDTPFEEIFNSRRMLFQHHDISFATTPVTPFRIEPFTPIDGEKIGNVHETIFSGWPLKYAPLKVRIKLTDRDGNPMDPEKMFTEYQSPIQVSVISPEITEPVKLLQDPSHPDEYFGEIDTDVDGPVQLKVELIEKPLGDFRADQTILQVDFERFDKFWHTEIAYYILLGAFVIALIVWFFVRKQLTNNPVGGTLEFHDGDEVDSFELYSKWNWKKIPKKWLKTHPEYLLDFIRVTNTPKVGTPKRKKQADDYYDDYDTEGSEQAIIITYKMVGKKKSHEPLYLYPESPETYSEEVSTVTLIYQPD